VFKSSWDKRGITDQLIFLWLVLFSFGYFFFFLCFWACGQLLLAALVQSQWTCRVASAQELELEVGVRVVVVLAVSNVLVVLRNGARPLGQLRSLA